MRALLLLLAACTCATVAVACAGSGSHASPSPTATPTATPTFSPSPTPTLGGIVAHVTCSGPGCITGKLRTVVYDCSTVQTVTVGSAGKVTLVATTSVTVALAALPAPETDCLHAIVDDSTGSTATSSFDPTVATVAGTSENVDLVVDVYAL